MAKILNKCRNCNQTEQKLENFKLCSGCRCVFYCSEKCQKEDWKKHKIMCNIKVEKNYELVNFLTTKFDETNLYLQIIALEAIKFYKQNKDKTVDNIVYAKLSIPDLSKTIYDCGTENEIKKTKYYLNKNNDLNKSKTFIILNIIDIKSGSGQIHFLTPSSN